MFTAMAVHRLPYSQTLWNSSDCMLSHAPMPGSMLSSRSVTRSSLMPPIASPQRYRLPPPSAQQRPGAPGTTASSIFLPVCSVSQEGRRIRCISVWIRSLIDCSPPSTCHQEICISGGRRSPGEVPESSILPLCSPPSLREVPRHRRSRESMPYGCGSPSA